MSAAHWYRGYGLLFHSDIALPELAPCAPGPVDVRIRLTQDLGIDTARLSPRLFHTIADDAHLMVLPDIGRFLMRGGTEILVQPIGACEPGLLRLYLIGSAMGMIFHQRGQLVMHGAGVVAHGRASLFVGESGAGKSTLSAHLGAAGHAILADDTVPLVERDGRFQAWPGSRVFKLWRDALDGLRSAPRTVEPVGNRVEKYYASNPGIPDDRPYEVAEIIELVRSDGPAMLEPVTGLAALKIVSANAYRPEFVTLLGREAPHFRLVAALAGSVRVLRLHRPWDAARLSETIDLLDAHWD